MSAEETYIKNLEEKSGKKVEEWIRIVKDAGLEKHKQILDFLKQEHGFTHGYANFISLKARETDAASMAKEVDLVEAMYQGKENLKPIYDKIIAALSQKATQIELAPKKAYVSLRAQKQFGLIQPSTKTRVDVGINLKGKAPAGRVEAAGSWNSMVSHRVKLAHEDEVDDELISWLLEAYEAAK